MGDGMGNAMGNIFHAILNYNPFTSSKSIFDDIQMTAEAVLPILGLFWKGFYNPLMSKLRHLPQQFESHKGHAHVLVVVRDAEERWFGR